MTQQPQHLSAGKDVDVRALLAIPAIAIASLIAVITIFTKWGITAAAGFWLVLMFALVLWTLLQFRRARRQIRGEMERCGCKIMEMNYRHLRIGPFSMWDTSRSQLVYRVVVRDATGRERILWARWGRRWFWNHDALELKWQDEMAAMK